MITLDILSYFFARTKFVITWKRINNPKNLCNKERITKKA